jgi:chromosome segregation ATPase
VDALNTRIRELDYELK